MLKSKIIASGSYLPPKVVYNKDLPKHLETSDEWISERTGILKRHIADESVMTSDLAVAALRTTGVDPKEIDGIIIATCTPDMILPSTAAIVAKKLVIQKAFAFDINAACSGYIHALIVADGLIKSGSAKKVAVIGAEVMTSVVDWNDRSTCVLFGDGAGALILEASNGNEGILASSLESDSSQTDILYATSAAKMVMNGREVYKHAVDKMHSSIVSLCEQSGVDASKINWVIPHQANQRILDAITDKMGIDKTKMISTISEHANTSAASIPLAFDVYVKSGKIKHGDLIALTAFGAGLSWGSILLKY